MNDTATPAPAFLDVARSIGGKFWRLRPQDERMGLAIAQRLQLPELVGRLLAARGQDLDSAEQYLTPTLKELLPDPGAFRDMDQAAARLVAAIERQETIAVFGDYDVDGATSAALLLRFLRSVGVENLRLYVPDRLVEGYGPNAPALEKLRAAGVGLVITVDCGITAFAPLEFAASVGLDVIVVDHHVAEPRLPKAAAVVNPNRLDETAGNGQLAAVGVAFLLVVALNRALREKGWYSEARPEPSLMQWLDIVALGTVCDVVPLTGVNRALVTQGLKVMARRGNIGLAALADVAGVNEKPTAYHAGFLLGPRVNAGGRVGRSDLGARLLSTDNPVEAKDIAQQLDTLNAERREIEAAVLEQAIALAEAQASDNPHLIFVSQEGWHPGVIGIVASRLKERFERPACVVALDQGAGKGSGRSVHGLHLGNAVIAAREAGIISKGGGHAMAAGFEVDAANVEDLRVFLAGRLKDNLGGLPLTPLLDVDGALQPRAANAAFAAQIERLAPFGSGNAEPRFVLPNARIGFAEIVGGAHVRCFIEGSDGSRIKGIAFRAAESDLGRALLGSRGAVLHLAGHLRRDTWQGRNESQLVIEDAARPTS